ncbi:UDP-3-O-(3-hydroxymyristoyl)glucosamine N-acyltransferase [Fimbriimonas ginsengisoli]|uniref:UDP-3-O-acylglucosamine N-acyltransferase n=1 Tax=Fimbriimonas ginsengisoli Gsoil 348 TaxID=661478 RepID=A0A068NU95_FIMGI|nr:UDP-3-O-(3-hydroxymyristoyl)glucosamine N-acyltransferase [Fimbriimonas ginsengisoli]AIE85179.1 UDP-3-O-[3-hydroxymyristoyl] glucosamine N-acyltransferase [Fimbriimonas ginsengisoli Gsoil 348]
MERDVPGWTLGELATLFGGELVGPADLRVTTPIPVDGVDPAGLTFAESDEFLRQAAAGGAAAVLAPKGATPVGKPTIFVDSPRTSFGVFLAMAQRPLPLAAGVHPTAVVSPEATVAESAQIGPYAVVERGAVIGERCRVFPFCYVGENCHLGEGTVLFPHAVLYQDVTIGARGIVHSGAVLGADGFGFTWNGQRQVKIPQVGGVTLGDDVEIGAITAVDRATAGQTMIGNDSKLDNLVQVGHNTRIGSHTVVASQTGISGSTRIGDRVTIAGQAATNDHITICDDVVLAGRTGVTSDIKEAGTYFGLPARPLGEAMRTMMLTTKLQELFKRVKDLERGKEIS